MWRVGLVIVLAACGQPGGNSHDASTGGGDDGAIGDVLVTDDGGDDGAGGTGNSDGGMGDGGSGSAAQDAGGMDAPAGIITGGPCMSGAAGATAYRVRWANGGGTAYPVYEVDGLPNNAADHVGAYGYQIGFTPSYVDPYLAQGGLQLDSSDFVDIDISTVGVTSIASATLSIYGRSFNTTASGSFNWQTFDGTGSTPTNFVSNVAPYAWYTADMTTEISPGDGGVKVRIKAGPSSSSLVVNRIEICMQAN